MSRYVLVVSRQCPGATLFGTGKERIGHCKWSLCPCVYMFLRKKVDVKVSKIGDLLQVVWCFALSPKSHRLKTDKLTSPSALSGPRAQLVKLFEK